MNSMVIFAIVISLTATAQARVTGNSVSKANNAFAVKLYKHLVKEKENLVCSPISVSTILSVLLQGSPETTETHKQILNSLEYGKLGLDLNKVENGYRELLNSLRSKGNVTLDLANSVWIRERFQVLEDFIKATKNIFKVDIKALREPNATEAVNKWVADRTKNKIQNLFGKLDQNAIVVLINAIYFEAPWDKSFFKDSNEEHAKFKSNDDVNSDDTVTLMKQTDKFPYYEDSNINARILAMNYKGKETQLVIFLPKDGHKLADLEASLTPEKIDNAINNARVTKVNVAIPKFNLTSSMNLEDTLKEMGMTKCFTDHAEFSKISSHIGVKVSQVIQKAIIEVSENGTIAAAATGIRGERALQYPSPNSGPARLDAGICLLSNVI